MPSGDERALSGGVRGVRTGVDRLGAAGPDGTSHVGSTAISGGRLLPSGDEAGTPPEDRAFRPDIQGLRAVAVLLVVIVHAQLGFLNGGFFGVDVFFVISGFVITGLLLRERSATGKTRILAFYGRRARRIVPAAMLVIVVSIVAERIFVGASATDFAASQARWASVFLANFWAAGRENILNPRLAPLGAYWSLAVEEQFYLVYPMLVVMVAVVARGRSLRVKLGVLLGGIAVASFAWSVVSSSGIGVLVSYVSPFTHAWELAVGGLLAVCAGLARKLPLALATSMTWVGLGTIILAAALVTGPSDYPGYIAALPVGGTALVIAGGTAAPRWGAEVLLKLAPFKWLGLWSFSIYLWHYPILTIARQRWGHLTVTTNLLLAVAAVVLAAGTYFAIENPIRHWSFLARFPLASVVGGAALIVAGLAMISIIA
jgi:peptidoglycan/LPS O-acetylase OafA/YrhL